MKKYIKVRKHPSGEEVEEEYSGSPEGGSQTVLVATKELLAADILQAFTVPFEVIAAPDADQWIEPTWIQLLYKYGTTPYTTSGNLWALINGPGKYQDDAVATWSGYDPLLDAMDGATTDLIYADTLVWGLQSTTPGDLLGQALNLGIGTSDPTDGDGTMQVTVHYLLRDASYLS